MPQRPTPSLSRNGRTVADALAAGDLAANDPIERAAVGQFVGPLRHHAGAVDVFGLFAAFALVLERSA